MNDLNSVLIEGEIFSPATRHGKDGELVSFYMRSKEEKRGVTLLTDILVQSTGKVGEMIEQWTKEGRSVRVVGKLQWDGMDHYIRAEHVEFKPPHKG